MRIAIGSDHRGFALKQSLIDMIRELGHEPDDMGCYDDEAVDYPDYAEKVARAVSKAKAVRGVLICGTGNGMSMAANKVPGVRAAVCVDALSARMARSTTTPTWCASEADLWENCRPLKPSKRTWRPNSRAGAIRVASTR